MRTLLIDNYDSFTFNLFQDLAIVNGCEPIVIKNDEMSWEEAERLAFDNIVISPGPGHPGVDSDFGISREAIAKASVPVLGVCLGHQGIALAEGARVIHAPEPIHGRESAIHHDGRDLFADIPSPFTAIRYHSLVVEGPLPKDLEATAWTGDGLIMGLRNRARPIWGVQFHPESIGTEHGRRIIANFKVLTEDFYKQNKFLAPDSRMKEADATTFIHSEGRGEEKEKRRFSLRLREIDCLPDVEALFLREFATGPDSFWLDSSAVISGYSRFSYLGDGRGPAAEVLRYRVRERTLSRHRARGDEKLRVSSFLDYLRENLEAVAIDFSQAPSLPFDFVGGYVGYLGYEMREECGLPVAWDKAMEPSSSPPDSVWIFVDRFVAVDHIEKKTYLVQLVEESAQAVAEAMDWESRLIRSLHSDLIGSSDDLEFQGGVDRPETGFNSVASYQDQLRHSPTHAREQIQACLRAIRDGESYELCLTNALELKRLENPFATYRRLRRLNPAPYGAYLGLADLQILCSSPERFLKIDRARWMEAKPIKGTAPRGRDSVEDHARAETLRTSIKERAENLMIVDLLRNDMGRVAEIGSVHVPKLMQIESYATVHQLVSTIRARLKEGVTAFDAIRSLFPGGSMTGAPKKRTVEILAGLEVSIRGVYSGAIGFFSVNGTVDLNIVIRTIVNRRDGANLGAGGAIVALSQPEAEIEEMMLKAASALRALESHEKTRFDE